MAATFSLICAKLPMTYVFRIGFACLGAFFPLLSTAQTPADSLAAVQLADSLLNVEATRDAALLLARATEMDSIFSEKAAEATRARETAEENWKTARTDSTQTKETVKSLEQTFKTAKNSEKTALAQRKQATRTLAFAGKVAASPPADIRKNLSKLRSQLDELTALAGLPVAPTETPIATVIGAPAVSEPNETPVAPPAVDTLQVMPTPEVTAKPREKPRPAPAKRFARYDPDADPMLNPPTPPCALAQNTRDEFSGETYRETQRAELFRFSNEYVKKTLAPGQYQVRCEAALAQQGPTPSLWLTFTLNDPNARKTFGSLNKGGLAVLKFMDGQTLNVYNLRADEGAPDATGRTFTFRAQYGLDRDALKKLQRTELDKIRVAWATGYEDYDVQNVNLLRRQAKCLE